jgi:hypothetical protein
VIELAGVNPGIEVARWNCPGDVAQGGGPEILEPTRRRVGIDVMVRSLVPMNRSADLDKMVGPELGLRLSVELEAALRRRPAQEASLGGLLRLLVGQCEVLREAAAAALDVLVRRNTLGRPLYAALLRSLVDAKDPRVTAPLGRALSLEDGGGLATIAAAALSDEPALADLLTHLASSRSPHVAFAADLARVARGESDGELLSAVAPRIKESHRIDLSNLMFLPLVRHKRRVPHAIAALEILRDSERHLGRWLCIAELTQLAESAGALAASRRFACEGPPTARAAWSLVAWALEPQVDCTTRPTLEMMARLSDRPSAERDLSFLFRMAEARLSTAKPMLESLVKPSALTTDAALRAAGHLARDFGRGELVARLIDTARSAKREPVRGLALAAIADCQQSLVNEVGTDLVKSRHHATAGFATLVRLAILRGDPSPIVTEATYRRLQLGWAD